ncbi:MAG: 3'(2'),5'-bisphosphate nucleotidase CysQ family protein, partial [Acetobacteraceae bacterium]
MSDSELLELAAGLALRAGEAILAVRAHGFDVRRKMDASPVTVADTEAEAIIVAGLREAAPEIPVIAEEEVAGGRVTAPSREYWLVDPLDGTREFAAGHEEFAVNIGLVRDNRAYLGVVVVPALGE